MVCQFEDDPVNWTAGTEPEGDLIGELQDGTEFEGVDSICVVT